MKIKMNRKDRTMTSKMTKSVDPAAKASVWGKGCAGKGGKTLNSRIPDPDNKQTKESE